MSLASIKVCILIHETNKVLLIKEKPNRESAYRWNVVKGTVDDEDIIEAALREAEEEVSVSVKLNESFGTHVK